MVLRCEPLVILRGDRILAAGPPIDSRDSADDGDYTRKMRVRLGNGKGGFHPIRPAKPKLPPASSSQSGLSRVAKASTADAAVTSAATQVRSDVSGTIKPLAAIRPIESGTSAAWIVEGQRALLERVRKRLTQ